MRTRGQGSAHRTTGVRRVAAVAAFALLVAGCGSSDSDDAVTTSDPVVPVPGATRAQPGKGAPVAETVAGMSEFAAALYTVAADPKANVVFSPLSIAYAFAMARAGAKGETAAQLDEAFGFPGGLDAAFNALTTGLASASAPPVPPTPDGEVEQDPPPAPPILTLANALFVQGGYPLLEGFLRTLTEQYGSQVRTVDFGNEQAALAAVNGWAERYTAGRIKKILEQLDSATRLVLANAVYLKADWTTPFESAGERDFAVAGTKVQVPAMDREDRLAYAKGAGWQSVDVPYFGDTLAMRVIVPTGNKTPADLLTPDVLAAAARTRTTELKLTMPLWDFGTTLDLRALLPKLGVTDAFDEGAADLTGMAEAERLFISQAVHKADITVDELGTIASAVTALGVSVTSARIPPPVEITVDRPFAFQIIDVKTGAPLFLGHVADPRAH